MKTNKGREIVCPIIILELTVILLIFSVNTGLAQQLRKDQFTVVHLPRKTGYSKAKLNQEMAKATSKEDVKKIIRLKNFSSATIIIQIEKGNGTHTLWTLNTGSNFDKEDENIVLQSKNITSVKFHKLSDFRSFFKDTLVLVEDSLKIELLINDTNYPDDQYFIRYSCRSNLPSEQKISSTQGKLIFTKNLIQGCIENTTFINIYNKNHPERSLASAKLIFLSDDQKDALMQLASFQKSKNPNLSLNDVALFVASYAYNTIGTLYFPQFITWLTNNLSASNNGNVK